jgi:hypothetical protein
VDASFFTQGLWVLQALYLGARRRIVVKAPCYKLEGRGFETRRGE